LPPNGFHILYQPFSAGGVIFISFFARMEEWGKKLKPEKRRITIQQQNKTLMSSKGLAE
jgi:hypothetical protein